MKKLLIISVFLGLGLSSYSQLEYFLPDSNAYFSVSPYKFWFQGDTTIGNKKYKKVFQQSGDIVADFQKATYYAAVREDTLAEKIYCIQKDDGIERLLSDFSLNEGDTISVFTFWGHEQINIKVKNVDSILIHSNYRKQVNFEHEGPVSEELKEAWIEGIGSTYGLFYPGAILHSIEVDYPRLLCVHIDDTLYYQKPNVSNCYQDFLVGINETMQSNISVFPTITSEYLYIDNLDYNYSKNDLKYQIINTQGKVLKSGNIKDSINVSILTQGLYFITIYDIDNVKILIKKFIKN